MYRDRTRRFARWVMVSRVNYHYDDDDVRLIEISWRKGIELKLSRLVFVLSRLKLIRLLSWWL